MKKLALGLVGLVVVVAGIALALYSSMDSLVKTAIEKVGSQVAGVPVRVSAVKLSLPEGKGTISGLSVGNPAGFKSDTALRVAEISLSLDPASVTKDPIVIGAISVNAPQVTYELGANGGSNLAALEANLGASKGNPPPAEGQSSRKLVIDRLDVTGGKVALASPVPGLGAEAGLADIHLTGIGRQGSGATAAQVAEQVLNAITRSALKSVGPAAVGAQLDAVKQDPTKAVDELKGMFGK